MDRETARQEIKSRVSCENYLEKSKSGLYCCPFCGSGTGPHKTGALKVYDTNTFYCHSCGRGGDVIDLFRLETGVDYNTALTLLAGELGITIDPYASMARKTPPNTPGRDPADYTEYYRECARRLDDPAAAAYLRERGISLETAAAHLVGFDPAADPARSNHPCPRIILPTSETHYVARRIDGGREFAKMNPRGSAPAIFNRRALDAEDAGEVFVTEGVFDALAVMEVGATAISLNGAANASALVERLERGGTTATLILCLDDDEAGREATKTIREGLLRLNIDHATANICGGYKDPNEALVRDRASFTRAVERARTSVERPDHTVHYIDALKSEDMEGVGRRKKTGFSNLDARARGLRPGLYVLAGLSSQGKTTFALQLADQLAESGEEVLFFSLEESGIEMVSKSLARVTARKDMKNAMTSLDILDKAGRLPQRALEAARDYEDAVGFRVSVVEGNFDRDISFIGDYIRRYMRRTKTHPVVFIDYLQILRPTEGNPRMSVKERVDEAVTELKRLSRELDLTILVISSVNRANYLAPVDLESLKESGTIEYTADVVWGLQPRCLGDPMFEQIGSPAGKRRRLKEAKDANPREMELVCLKDRHGRADYSCRFDYYAKNDLFVESAGPDPDPTPSGSTTPKAGRKL